MCNKCFCNVNISIFHLCDCVEKYFSILEKTINMLERLKNRYEDVKNVYVNDILILGKLLFY